MEVNANKVVSITYLLRLGGFDGEIIEQVDQNNPFKFVFGVGLMLPSFEQNLNGLKVGESFKFSLTPEDAYGEYRPDLLVDVPMSAFNAYGIDKEGLLKIGNIIPMQDENGNEFSAEIKEINDDRVKMDFNHPLAGKTLYFEGVVLDVRDATEDEISERRPLD